MGGVSGPSEMNLDKIAWKTHYSAAPVQHLQRALEQGIALDEQENEPPKQHRAYPVQVFLPLLEVPGYNVVVELKVLGSDRSDHKRWLKSGLSTDGNDCMGVLCMLTEYMGAVMRAAFADVSLTNSLRATTTEESKHTARLQVITRCLQALHVPRGHLVPVVRATEEILAALPGCCHVRIHCVDESDGQVVYSARLADDQHDTAEDDSIGGRDERAFRSNSSARSHSYDSSGRLHIDALRAMSPEANGNFNYELEFQVYEVKGSVRLNTSEAMCDLDKAIMQALVKATGRRIYELYRGKRHKKAYAELQRNLEKTS